MTTEAAHRTPKLYDVPLPLKKAGVPLPGSLIRFKLDSTIRMIQPGFEKYRNRDEDQSNDPVYWNVVAGTSGTITRVVSNTDNATVYVTLEVLTQEATGSVVSGWINIVESSKFKEWDWMVPPMRTKMIQNNFDELFEIVISA